MAVQSTDLLMIERAGVLHKAAVSDLPSGGGGADPGLVLLQQEVITTPVNAVDFDLPAEYSRFKLMFDWLQFETADLAARVSTDGGATFVTTSTYGGFGTGEDYAGTTIYRNKLNTNSLFGLSVGPSGTPKYASASLDILSTADVFSFSGGGNQQHGSVRTKASYSGIIYPPARVNLFRIYEFTGTDELLSGKLSLYAYKETA